MKRFFLFTTLLFPTITCLCQGHIFKANKQLDSFVNNWSFIKPANPNGYCIYQYKAIINNKDVFFNINFRAINIREQKDITIWTDYNDTIKEYYCDEYELFGKLKTEEVNGKYAVCPKCPSPKKEFPNKKYLLSYSEENRFLILRFNDDSTSLKGVFIDTSYGRIKNQYFIAQKTHPSLKLNYHVSRFHKHQKMIGSNIKEVSSTVLLGLMLPDTTQKHYNDFLKWQASLSTKKFSNRPLQKIIAMYEKTFTQWRKQSNIKWSRSIAGMYDNSEVISNQYNWLIIKVEGMEGAIDYYGDMNFNYFTYDVANETIIEPHRVFKNYNDSLLEIMKDSLHLEFNLLDFGFIDKNGVYFKTSGNHGWEVGLFFISFKQLQPFIKKDFIKSYPQFFK